MSLEALSPVQQEFYSLYNGLNRNEQILFMAVLLYESTLAGRGTYEVGTEGVEDAYRLRGLNELQHRLSDHLLHLITDYQKRRSDEDFLNLVLHLCKRYQVPLSRVLEKFKKHSF